NGNGSIAFNASYSVINPITSTLGSNVTPVLTGLVVGDINRDCRQDIIVSNLNGSNIAVFLGHGDGTFADCSNWQAELQGQLLTGTDIVSIDHSTDFSHIFCLDKNSAPGEFVVRVPRATQLFVQGAIIAPPAVTEAVEQDPQAIAFGHLTHSGFNDMVVANRAAATLNVFINDGSGNFTQPYAPIATGLQPEGLAIADVDGDGYNDVLVACNGSDAVYVHLNLGGGSLAGGNIIPTNAKGPHAIIAVDMDLDNRVDFVTANQYDNSVSCFTNTSTGPGNVGFVPAAGFNAPGYPPGVFPVGNGPLGLAIGDLSNGGKPEIVTANSNDDSVTVLLRSGASTNVVIGSAVDYPLGGFVVCAPANSVPAVRLGNANGAIEPVSISIGDLNHDGFQDLAVVGKASGTVTILYGGRPFGEDGTPLGPITRLGGAEPITIPSPASMGTNLNTGSGLTPGPNNTAPADPLPVGPFVAGNFWIPTDYFHYGNNTAIGTPPIVLVVGANPVAVKMVDMNDDGILDICVGSFGGQNVVDFINQGNDTQWNATGPFDLKLQNAGPPAFIDPSQSNVIAGEAAFVFDPKKGAILYSTGAIVSFTAGVGQPVTAMDVQRLTANCPPDVGVTSPDDNARVFTVK
ncbi:MAG TPA: VCBS repeat-containing protein, partial [Planctomycetota bacterium]|nr:VCBS repeat-containing protein [Planctomycetota bacterium]